MDRKTPILILAAGASRRLGQPKQLLAAGSQTLLERTINECLKARVGEVYVVLGAHKEQIRPQLSEDGYKVICNENWADGLGGSLSFGVAHISKVEADGVIVVLGDQPYFTGELLAGLITKQQETNAKIVISDYAEGSGPPSLFMRQTFSDLLLLTGDEGAKSVVKKYKGDVTSVLFPKGHIDIDTKEDLRHLDHFQH